MKSYVQNECLLHNRSMKVRENNTLTHVDLRRFVHGYAKIENKKTMNQE